MNPSEGHTQQLSNLDSKHIRIIAYPITVVLIAELVAAVFGLHPITVGGLRPIDSTGAAFSVTEAALRMRVLGLFLLLAIGAVAIITRFDFERRSLFNQETASDLLKGAVYCLVTAAAIIGLSVIHIIPASFDVLGQDLFQRAFALVGKYPNTVTHVMSERTLWWLMNLGGLLVGAATASLIMSAISSLAETESTDLEIRKAHWKLQSERLQLTIYISTGLLVVGLLYIQSWAQWPTFAFAPVDKPPSQFASDYATLVNSYLAFTGIEYSLLLASFAIPVTVFLNAQANAIAADSFIDKEKKRIVKENEKNLEPNKAVDPAAINLSPAIILAERKSENLVVQFIDQLKTMAAILAPFIAGSLGNLATLLTSKT